MQRNDDNETRVLSIIASSPDKIKCKELKTPREVMDGECEEEVKFQREFFDTIKNTFGVDFISCSHTERKALLKSYQEAHFTKKAGLSS